MEGALLCGIIIKQTRKRLRLNASNPDNSDHAEAKKVYRLMPMVIALALFSIFIIAGPAAADQESDDAKVLRQFGEQIVKNNPSLASASNLEKAKAGFVEYLKRLSASNAGVSNDVWGRISDKLFADKRTAFTCSVHTFNLQDIFAGMGINSQSIGQIGGEMDTYNQLYNYEVIHSVSPPKSTPTISRDPFLV